MDRNLRFGAATVGVISLLLVMIFVFRDDGGGGFALAVPPAQAEGDGPPLPLGQADGWELAFSDEFDGSSLDAARWADRSGAEADAGRGNNGNKQLEWNQAANCAVGGGELTMTARREPATSPSGERYGWTSCLIASTPSYGFRFGYVEERAILPRARGFWPALWTWQAPFENRYIE